MAQRMARTASSALASTMAHLRPLGVSDVYWGVVNVSHHPAAAAAASHGQRGTVQRWLYRDMVHLPARTLQ